MTPQVYFRLREVTEVISYVLKYISAHLKHAGGI